MAIRKYVCLYFALIVGVCPALFAADGSTKPTRSPTATEIQLQTLITQFESTNSYDVNQAVASLKEKLAAQPDSQLVIHLRSVWGPRLIELKRYEDLDRLAVLGILARPDELPVIAELQRLRARAFFAAGSAQAALGAAKGYYNVCPLAKTGDGISLVSTALAHAYPEDGQIARRFRAQQAAGATTQPTDQATPSTDPADKPVLASIKVEDDSFKDAIANDEAWEVKQMIGKANLLLLSDQCKAAKTLMQQAYDAAESPADVTAATEGLARAMRAEDGNVGGANAWLMKLKAGK